MTGRSLLTIIVVFFAVAAQAQSGSVSGDLTGTRPNDGGEPEEITVRLGLLDIVGIDDRAQTFAVDIFLEIEWQDARLVAADDVAGALRTFALGDIWTPRLTIINNRGVDFLLPEVATADREGNVIVRQRLAGPLAVNLDLRTFPFDSQRLPIELASYQYSQSEIVFSEDSELIARLDELGGEGWSYSALDLERSIYRLKDGGRGGSALTFSVMAERNPIYYVFTLALPMTLILFLAWMAHWLPVDIVPPRMATATATVFSLVALGVSFRLTLPKIAYLTHADRFGLYSTLLVLASLAVTVVTIRWASRDRKDAAQRLARQTRLAFPFLYGLIVLLTFTT
jgi:hypothetical protein